MFQLNIPQTHTILEPVPVEEYEKCEKEFWHTLAHELIQLLKAAAQGEQAQVVVEPFKHIGSQYLLEFYVNDLARPRTNSMNFHGQNTSQWLYAGAIVIQDGRVSAHH
jgi:hypothetical protein